MEMKLQLPMALVALTACAGTANAVSLSLIAKANVPTQQFPCTNQRASQSSEAFTWMAFAEAAIPDARQMNEWERQDADEFFWSHFA